MQALNEYDPKWDYYYNWWGWDEKISAPYCPFYGRGDGMGSQTRGGE